MIDITSKCIVFGCNNHKGEGFFVGDLCAPCHNHISTGRVGKTESFLGGMKEMIEKNEKTIRGYQLGNTVLFEALMDMAAQYLSVDGDSDDCHHGFMCAGENSMAALEEAGLASTDDQIRYTLLWEKIEERKKALGMKP